LAGELGGGSRLAGQTIFSGAAGFSHSSMFGQRRARQPGLAMPGADREQAHRSVRSEPVQEHVALPHLLRLACVLVGTGILAILLGVAGHRWYQAELRRAELEIKAGQVRSGRARLVRLGRLGLAGAETQYWLAACDEAEGHFDAALETWARIPRGSARFANATIRRARLALERGRYALAEEALENVQFPPGSAAFEMRERLLQQVYYFTGRSDELRRRKHVEWAYSGHKAEVLRTHWQIDEPKSFPVGAIREHQEKAGRLAPDDDRLWLGRAILAIRTAEFDEADTWLKRCLKRRPEDPAVWRARLEWAMASDRLSEAIEAARHLPDDWLEPEQLLMLRAWMAVRLGKPEQARSALSELLKRQPGDAQALAQLTEMALRDGQNEQAAQLRRRKMDVDRAMDEYRKILTAQAPSSGFDHLGQVAESLGRWFEATGWWSLALRDPEHADQARVALARLQSGERARHSTDDPVPERPRSTEVPPNATAETPRFWRPPAAADSEVRPPLRTLADALADLIPRDTSGQPATLASLAVPVFRDDAHAAGLDVRYDNDPTPLCRMPESMGGGVGLLDYDSDGWVDVYAVQGGPLSIESTRGSAPQRDRLLRNRGNGTFEDVTKSSGLSAFPGGYGHGVAVGDFDNDGHPDLFITRWRSYALYRNRGNGTFVDVTQSAGLAGTRDWPTSAAFADLDGDGDLDLYVCHYSAWDPQLSPPCPHPTRPGAYSYCGPRVFDAMPDHVFRNDGGFFVDVSDQSGVRSGDRDGRGLGVVAAHLDDDRRIDLFVANDLTANYLFRNRGDFRFDELGAESGLAGNAEGGYLAGMGIASGDLDGDGRIDLAVTNFYGESTTFYRNLGAGQFADHTAAIGLTAPSRYLLGFGAAFFDANNDGLLDLVTANGHVNDLSPNVPYAMPAQLLLGQASARLIDVSHRAGDCWQVRRLGRGLAVGDLDNDGRLDLLIVSEGEPLAYFHNRGPAGHFITLQLEGSPPRSNRDAIGAQVTISAAGRRQVAQRVGGGSFLSASDARLHFGLGEAAAVDSVEVLWPSGQVDHYGRLASDTGYLLREGRSEPSPMRGWRR
jgi:tetratricopeptide (TPR) repeat protein